jgi:GDP-L-fucose synthase
VKNLPPITIRREPFRLGRIFVAGHRGVVGSALHRHLAAAGYDVFVRTREELDLRDPNAVCELMRSQQIDTVVLAAAKVGGIQANIADPVGFLQENLAIQGSVIQAVADTRVSTLMFLGSSCIYPRDCPQPMRECDYLRGPLEPTNESYAVAKIAGIRLAQAVAQMYGIRVLLPMPSNVYGPGDHFDFARSHVLSAMVRRFHDALTEGLDTVTLWGSGSARREFIHTADLSRACCFMLEYVDDSSIVNVGSGVDVSIRELSELVSVAVGYNGNVEWDTSKPDGMPRKLMDTARIRDAGWSPAIALPDGIRSVVSDYQKRRDAE